ncbi:unnamed protein product, partial [Choristocarpus tenellus]
LLRELVKSVYVKNVDPRSGRRFYTNRRTGEVTYKKSICFGADDLETPR